MNCVFWLHNEIIMYVIVIVLYITLKCIPVFMKWYIRKLCTLQPWGHSQVFFLKNVRKFTVKRFPTTFWSTQLHSFCVHDITFKECFPIQIECVVEKLLSFVKFVFPFRELITSFQKAYKSAYQLRFVVSLTLHNHLTLESSLVANARNVAKWVFWRERLYS